MIAEKILSSIEFIHYKSYVHRDIKPENFLMGLGKKLHQIYTIDFAYATTYFNPNEKTHRPNDIDEERFIGTMRFLSLNVIQGNRNSRRDDLESVGLMLIYFLKGSLPWQGCLSADVKNKRK
jgi:serine/threonine protein kinase